MSIVAHQSTLWDGQIGGRGRQAHHGDGGRVVAAVGERVVAAVDELATTGSGRAHSTIAVGVQERKKRRVVVTMDEGKIGEVKF